MKKKAIVWLLLAVLALTAVLAGCGSNDKNRTGADADGKIHLTYWYAWKDKIAENNLERIQEFNDTVGKENNIVVTAEYQGSYDDLQSKMQSAFVANEEPDVAVMEISSTKPFADGGMLQPIDEFVSQEDIDDFYPGLLANCYVDGKLYGVPYLRSTPILYYNKTLFQKAGLNPEKGPSNWQELAQMSKQLGSIGIHGLGFVADMWQYEGFMLSDGAAPLNDNWTEATFNSPQGVDMATYLRDCVQHNNFKYYSGSLSAAKDVLLSDVVNQKTAMWLTSTGDLSTNLTLAQKNGYEVGVAFIPKNVQNKVPTGGCNLVMTSRISGDKRKAAAMLINFMTNKENAVKNHMKTGYLPTRKSCADNEDVKKLYQQIPQLKVALDQLQYGTGRPMAESYKEVSKIYTEAMDKIMTSDVDIQTTLDEAAKKCTELLQDI